MQEVLKPTTYHNEGQLEYFRSIVQILLVRVISSEASMTYFLSGS